MKLIALIERYDKKGGGGGGGGVENWAGSKAMAGQFPPILFVTPLGYWAIDNIFLYK